MSLETLLEAAKIIESRSKEDESYNFHPYAKKAPTEVHVEVLTTERGDSSQSFDFDDDEDDFSRERRRPGGAGTREVHNKLEKNRDFTVNLGSHSELLLSIRKVGRAHLKECFNFLKKNIPTLEERRTSNLGILRGSLRYIQTLRRKEREHESEMQKLASEKITLQEKIQALKGELQNMNIEVDLNAWMTAHASDNESHSTSTATEGATPPPSDHGDDDDEEEADQLAMETNPSPTPKVISRKLPQRMPSVRELLNNGRQSSKVVDAIQGLMAANKVNHNVRPLLPNPTTTAPTVNSEIPQTLTFKTTPTGQLIIPKQLKIPVSLALTTDGGVKAHTSNVSQQLAFIPKFDTTHTLGKTQQSSIAQQLNSNIQTISQQKPVTQQNFTQLTTTAPQQISLADLAKIQEQVMRNIEKQAGLLQKDGHQKDNNYEEQLTKVRDMTKVARQANVAQKTGNLSQQTLSNPQQTTNAPQQMANVPQQMANFSEQARLNKLANIQSQLLSATSMTAASSQQLNNFQVTNIQQPAGIAKQPVTISQPVSSEISTLAQLANIVEQTSLIHSSTGTSTIVNQQTKVGQQTTANQQTASQQTNVSRPPVTQILHQTLTQRQALAKQTASTPQVSAPLTGVRLKAPHLTQALIPVTIATTVAMTTSASVTSQQTTPMKFEYIATPVNMVSTPVKVDTTLTSSTGYIATPLNMISTPVKLDTNLSSSVNLMSVPFKLENGVSSANQDTKNVTSSPVSLSMPYYMASLPKFAHPILVTSLTAPTLAALVSSNAGVTPVETIKTETSSSTPVAMVTSSSVPGTLRNQVQTTKIVQNTPLAAGLQVRPFLASNFLSGQFLPLIAHSIPQTSISATPNVTTVKTTVSGQFTTVPIMSLAQINPLTQLVSPVTVMSPGMQLGSAGLTQQQLNNMFSNSPLLKQYTQVPVLTQSLLPQGQILGQQVVKPVVMVTLPSMVTTSAISLPTTSAVIQSE